MKIFGLIGYPLSHSFSETYFGSKFQEEGTSDRFAYRNFPLASIEEFPLLIQQESQLAGLNVTIPYKEQVIPYLDELSKSAHAIGAVNTIQFVEGRLIGYNTDVIGFGDSLEPFLQANGGNSKGALILGTGGASKGIAWVLDDMDIPFRTVSRTKGKADLVYQELSEEHFVDIDLIINTTPVGTSPHIDTCPDIPYHCLNTTHRLYDLVYNPAETLFMQRGTQYGAAVMNGLAMLHGQAEAAWTIWHS